MLRKDLKILAQVKGLPKFLCGTKIIFKQSQNILGCVILRAAVMLLYCRTLLSETIASYANWTTTKVQSQQ